MALKLSSSRLSDSTETYMYQVATIAERSFADRNTKFSDHIADIICQDLGYNQSVDWFGDYLLIPEDSEVAW